MIEDYMIAKGKNVSELTEVVKKQLAAGWIPQGGVSVTLATSPVFVQALVRKP